jgi:glycosyltransferase involved in cell wall biosynthesis
MTIAELCLSRDLGGLELYFLRVVERLSRSDAGCVAVVAPGCRIESRLAGRNVDVRRLGVRFRWLPILAARRLARWIDERDVDAIHLHHGKDLPLAVLARKLARRRVRIVYSRQMMLGPKRSPYHRWLYRHVDAVLVISRQLVRDARRFLPLPPERVHLLYYGVPAPARPDPHACADLRERIGIPPGRFAIGLFGRIERQKGQHLLVEAVALLTRRERDVHAVLFGAPMKPGYLDGLRARIKGLGVEDRVHFYGFHPRPDEVMGCFDCIVLTTYGETFGLVLVEAMRAGVAVVGTAGGGVPEIIEDGATGLLVPEDDPSALADAIERLARDPALRARLAAAGKVSADERFDEERHFEELFAHLEVRAAMSPR